MNKIDELSRVLSDYEALIRTNHDVIIPMLTLISNSLSSKDKSADEFYNEKQLINCIILLLDGIKSDEKMNLELFEVIKKRWNDYKKVC